MDLSLYHNKMRINVPRFRELLRIQEGIISRDPDVLRTEDIAGFDTLLIRRYLSRIKPLLESDPKDHWDFNLPVTFVDEMPNTQSEEETNAMQILKGRMVFRVEDFKGHNPAT